MNGHLNSKNKKSLDPKPKEVNPKYRPQLKRNDSNVSFIEPTFELVFKREVYI